MVDMEALASRVEALDGPDYKVDAEIARATGWRYRIREGSNAWQWYSPGKDDLPFSEGEIRAAPPTYTASIDAAMTLVPEGWNWMAGNRNQPVARAYVENGRPAFVGYTAQRNPERQWYETTAANPALALTAAALRAIGQNANGKTTKGKGKPDAQQVEKA